MNNEREILIKSFNIQEFQSQCLYRKDEPSSQWFFAAETETARNCKVTVCNQLLLLSTQILKYMFVKLLNGFSVHFKLPSYPHNAPDHSDSMS